MLRAYRSILLLLVPLMLLACSGGDDPAAPEPTPTTQATKTIPPTGGSIRVENAAGVALNVSLPSGAVLEPTTVTLRAVATPTGTQARFVIVPAGLDLLAPATITVTLPSGMVIDETSGLTFVSGESIRVPTDVDLGARTLRATLYHLGFALPVPFAALATASDEGEFIDVDQIECQLLFESLTDAILRAQAFSGAFPPDLASPLILQYRAMLATCPTSDSLATVTAALQQYACSNRTSAESQAQVLIVESVEDFKRSLGALLAAEGIVQSTGADCHVQSNVIESEFSEYIDSYLERIEDPGFTASFANWDALWRELVPVTTLAALADEFELPSARERIEQELMPALFARLREVAGDACEEDENNALLGDILSGGHLLNHPISADAQMPSFTGFSQSDLLDQYHRCGSTLVLETRAAQGGVIMSATVGEGGNPTGDVTVINNGTIVIEDNLLALMCGQTLARDVVKVIAEIPNSLPVVQLGELNTSMNVNVAATLNALPTDEPQPFDLVFRRDRSQCGIDNGGTPTIELYRVHVNVLGAIGAGGGTWVGACTSGEVSGTFSFQIDNQGRVTGSYGGSASGSIDGVVNGSGTFNAAANGTAGPCSWSGTINGVGNNGLTGSGTWSCGGAGCSGTWSLGQ